MSHAVVVATLVAKEGRFDDAVAAITPAVEATHQEEGCLNYALHRVDGAPDTLVVVERWTSPETLAAHRAAPHMVQLRTALGDILAERPTLMMLEGLPKGDAERGTL
jgi:quinol monooxygenase YgiN